MDFTAVEDLALDRAASADFGNTFPSNATKGDLFTKTDVLPHKLFRYNGDKWIIVEKTTTESYLSQQYIKHLVQQIKLGIINIEDLSEVEQEEVRTYNISNTSG